MSTTYIFKWEITTPDNATVTGTLPVLGIDESLARDYAVHCLEQEWKGATLLSLELIETKEQE